jgi:hypothetical protein
MGQWSGFGLPCRFHFVCLPIFFLTLLRKENESMKGFIDSNAAWNSRKMTLGT